MTAVILAAVAACSPDPAATPAPQPAVPAMDQALSVPPPAPRPETRALSQAQIRRDRAEAARKRARTAAAPSAASVTMADYLRGIEDTLIGRGMLNTDAQAGSRVDAATLARDFVQIALRDEYEMRSGRLVPQAHAAPLRRWAQPVRIAVEFGPSVPAADQARDRATIADFAARLARITGHDIALTGGTGNFAVLIVNEDERRAIGPRLAQLVPGIPQGDVRALENLSPQNYCTVFAYSPGARAAYSNAVAVIRAELPQRLRTSCVHEELAQGLGLANDSPEARPSIFNDDEEFAFLTAHDELLLKILYDKRLRPGMTEAEARPIVERIAAELTGGAPRAEPAPDPGAS